MSEIFRLLEIILKEYYTIISMPKLEDTNELIILSKDEWESLGELDLGDIKGIYSDTYIISTLKGVSDNAFFRAEVTVYSVCVLPAP